MKKEMKKLRSSSLALCLWLLGTGAIFGQDYQKSFEETFEDIKNLSAAHRNGNINVLSSEDNHCKIVVELKLSAASEDDAQIVFDHFQFNKQITDGLASVETDFPIRNWNAHNGRIKVTFEDQKTVKDIRDFEMNMTIYIPKLQMLKLVSRYGKIDINTVQANHLEVDLYDGDLFANNVNGNFTLNMKYSDAEIGNFGNGKFDIYDSKLKAGNGGNIALKSKYSKYEFLNLGNIELSTYDDQFEFGNIGSFSLVDKYSKLEVGNFGNARLDLYDSDLIFGNGANIAMKSKYSTLVIGNIVSFDFELSYEDQIQIGQVQQITGTSRYSKFNIGQLVGGKFLLNSYEDEIYIEQVVNKLEHIQFTSKYSDLFIRISQNLPYQFAANLKYVDFKYPKDRINTTRFIEEDDEILIEGMFAGATKESPLVEINAYEGEVIIQE